VFGTTTRYLYFVLNLKTLTLYLRSGTLQTREYWMIYRGPGFLEAVWFSSLPTLFPPSPVSKLSLFLGLFLCFASRAYWREGWGGERGAKSYDREKAWPSISYSILSAVNHIQGNSAICMFRFILYLKVGSILILYGYFSSFLSKFCKFTVQVQSLS
jgi:hypothetical protein